MGKVEIGVNFEENMTNMKYSNVIEAHLSPQDNEIMMQHSDRSFCFFCFFVSIFYSLFSIFRPFFLFFFKMNEES